MCTSVPFVIRAHLRIFQFIGCFDISIQDISPSRQRVERRLIIWTSILLIAYSCLTVNTFCNVEKFLFTYDRFGFSNDIFKVLVAQSTITVTFLETILCREAVRIFWQQWIILNQSSIRFPKDVGWRSQLRTHKRFLLIFYGIVIMDLIIAVLFLTLQQEHDNNFQFWFMFLPYVYLGHLRNMQFIFHIEILRHELVKLRHDIALLADYTSFADRVGAFEGFDEFVRRKLVEKQIIYERIYTMFDNFQKGFGMSIISVMFFIYIRVLVDAYFTYYGQHRSWCDIEMLIIVPYLFEIPVLLITSKNCMNVVKFISFELHNIRSSIENPVISIQIQNFSLQILHQKIRIDGMGIAPLDGYMLCRIVGSVTAFMIFFVQFTPKYINED